MNKNICILIIILMLINVNISYASIEVLPAENDGSSIIEETSIIHNIILITFFSIVFLILCIYAKFGWDIWN